MNQSIKSEYSMSSQEAVEPDVEPQQPSPVEDTGRTATASSVPNNNNVTQQQRGYRKENSTDSTGIISIIQNIILLCRGYNFYFTI